jgi:hypothetical protein
MHDTATRRPGRPAKLDIALMATWALLVVRLHGADRKPATHAAILAYFTWTDDEHPDRRPAIHETAVLKHLQRIESGRKPLHPLIINAAGICDRATGKPVKKTIRIERNPCLWWNAQCAAIETDRHQNRTFSKKKSRGHIDGIVSLCMAVGACEVDMKPAPKYQLFFV